MHDEVAITAVDRIAIALLPLIGETVTAAELASRASSDLLPIDMETAGGLIQRLSTLGLVTVAEVLASGDTRYVITTLGKRVAESTVGDHPETLLELREVEYLRTELLATIGHELRTPLTAIRTCVGLLLDISLFPTVEERQQLLSTIARSADRMQRLLEELLDLARFRAGRVTLSPRRFDAVAVAHDVVSTIRPLADMAAQHVVVTAAQHPQWVVADHRRVEQALLNLVSNAQKYSPQGGTIEVEVASEDGMVRWSVTDDGPGISAEDQARLFERFFVGAIDRTGPGGGVGLGLPTAEAIALAHGGTIEVDSAPGRGSRFTLAIPLLPGAGAQVDL